MYFFHTNISGNKVQIDGIWKYLIYTNTSNGTCLIPTRMANLKIIFFFNWKLFHLFSFIIFLERFRMCLSKHLGLEEPGSTLIRLKWIQG